MLHRFIIVRAVAYHFGQTAFYPGELPELTLTGDELAQVGDSLTRSGLLDHPLEIELLPGKMIIRAESGVCLRNNTGG